MMELETAAEGLRDPSRRAILRAFYNDREPRTVDAVATGTGLHRTVAFGHLERLVRLGLLVSERRRGRRGKPAKVYRPALPWLEVTHPTRRFSDLAPLLATSLSRFGAAGVEAARTAGFGYGARVDVDIALLGGDYLIEGSSVTARNCVFREACDSAREVVCAVHAGLLEGALAKGGSPRRVIPAGPVGPTGCRFQIEEGSDH